MLLGCSLILLLQSALCRQALEGSHLTHFNWREASSRSRVYNIHILKVNAPPTPNRDLLYTTQLAYDNDVADSWFLESVSVIDLIEYCKPETRTRNPGLPFSKPETRVWTTGSGFRKSLLGTMPPRPSRSRPRWRRSAPRLRRSSVHPRQDRDETLEHLETETTSLQGFISEIPN